MIVFEVRDSKVSIYGGHPELDVIVVDHDVPDNPPGVFRCAPMSLTELDEATRELVVKVGGDTSD